MQLIGWVELRLAKTEPLDDLAGNTALMHRRQLTRPDWGAPPTEHPIAEARVSRSHGLPIGSKFAEVKRRSDLLAYTSIDRLPSLGALWTQHTSIGDEFDDMVDTFTRIHVGKNKGRFTTHFFASRSITSRDAFT